MEFVKKTVTWKRLVELEPRLADLLKQAQAVDGSPENFCASNVWYGNTADYPDFKMEIVNLVGWGAEGIYSEMRTQEAYDLAYEKIYESLPPCRDCSCL